jgi:hypothetical protein
VKLKLYIPTCDRYQNAMHANVLSMKQYWAKEIPVVILGYELPSYALPDNYTFISLGTDRGPASWGGDMLNYFSSIEDEFILYDNDDTILLNSVYYEDIEELIKIMQFDRDVQKINITGDVCCRDHDSYKSEVANRFANKLVVATQNSDYRLSVQGAIWNRVYFMKYLQEKMTPWEFELEASQRAINDGAKILGTKSYHPVIRGHIYRKGQSILNTDPDREWWQAWNKTGINPLTDKKYELDKNSDLYKTIKTLI